MDQPKISTLEAARRYVGPDVVDEHLQDAWEAAEGYVGVRCRWRPVDGVYPPAPDDLVRAVMLQTARYLQRRQSPDGLVGMGDLGVGRVPISDRDVDALMRPYRKVVFG